MNVLLFGKTESIFIRDYCKNVLNAKKMHTVVLSQRISSEYMQDYADVGAKVVTWPECFLVGLRNKMKDVFILHKIIKEIETQIGFEGGIDIMHVHYVEPLHIFYFFPLWRHSKKKILTFWGSDLYTASKMKQLLMKYFLKSATSVVFMIENQLEYFQGEFGHRYDEKVHIIDFGNSLIDDIDIVIKKTTKQDCKRHFDFSTEKIIVHVGYNASKAQQHIEIIQNMKKLPREVLEKMTFVFFVSYRRPDDFDQYKNCLTDIMDDAKLDYVFVDRYLQGKELAMFRCSCDLFVYGQKTDARSESPMEYIYAGAEFICPEWLSSNYELFDRNNVNYYKYDTFDSLNEIVCKCLKQREILGERITEKQKEKIREEISWDSLAEKWRALYE